MKRETFCPAKINLFLQIEGRRPDGFHELTSLVSPLEFGETLRGEAFDGDRDELEISGLPLEVNSNNLILRASELYREAVPEAPHFRWHLEKRIPWGAGLGGGSSNAAGAFRILQEECSHPLNENQIVELGAKLGADVPLFVRDRAGWMTGKGEKWKELTLKEKTHLDFWKVYLFFPGFGVSTPWAYQTMASKFTHLYGVGGEDGLEHWRKSPHLPTLLYNSLETVVGSKYIAISTLLGELRYRYMFPCLMSGSGSCCFGIWPEGANKLRGFQTYIEKSWGCKIIETTLRW